MASTEESSSAKAASRPPSPDQQSDQQAPSVALHSRKRSRGDTVLEHPDALTQPSLPPAQATSNGSTPLAKRGRQSPTRALFDPSLSDTAHSRGSPPCPSSVDQHDARPAKKQRSPPLKGMTTDTNPSSRSNSRSPSPMAHQTESKARSRRSTGSSASCDLSAEVAGPEIAHRELARVNQRSRCEDEDMNLSQNHVTEGKEVKAVRRAVGEIEVIEGMETDDLAQLNANAIPKKISHDNLSAQVHAEQLNTLDDSDSVEAKPAIMDFAQSDSTDTTCVTAPSGLVERVCETDAPSILTEESKPVSQSNTDTFSTVFGKYANPWSTAKPTAEAAELFGSSTASETAPERHNEAETINNLAAPKSQPRPVESASKAQALFGSPVSQDTALVLTGLTKSTPFGRGNAFGTAAIREGPHGTGFVVSASDDVAAGDDIPSQQEQVQTRGFGRFAAGASSFKGFTYLSSDSAHTIRVPTEDAIHDSSSAHQVNTEANKTDGFLNEMDSRGATGLNGHLALDGFAQENRLQGFERQDFPSGEEDWDLIHVVNCKLHILGSDAQWHERGFGPLKVLQRDYKTYRLVMRSKGVHRLILNGLLFCGFTWDVASEKQLRFTIPCFNMPDGSLNTPSSVAASETQSSTTQAPTGSHTPTISGDSITSASGIGNTMVSYLVRFPDSNQRKKFEQVLQQAMGVMKDAEVKPRPLLAPTLPSRPKTNVNVKHAVGDEEEEFGYSQEESVEDVNKTV